MLTRHFDHTYLEIRWIEPEDKTYDVSGNTHREAHPEGVLCSTYVRAMEEALEIRNRCKDLMIPAILFYHVSSFEEFLQTVPPVRVEVKPRHDFGVRVWQLGGLLYGANTEVAKDWKADTPEDSLGKVREAFPGWDWRVEGGEYNWWLESVQRGRTLVLRTEHYRGMGVIWKASFGKVNGREVEVSLRHTLKWSLSYLKEVMEMLGSWFGEENDHAQ